MTKVVFQPDVTDYGKLPPSKPLLERLSIERAKLGSQPEALPAYVPDVIRHDDAGLYEFVIRDCATVYERRDDGAYDAILDMETREVIGCAWPIPRAKFPAPFPAPMAGGETPRQVAEQIAFQGGDGERASPLQMKQADQIEAAIIHFVNAALATALQQRDEAVKALEPFAAAVYNDNGDVTISTNHLRNTDYMRARKALSSLRSDKP